MRPSCPLPRVPVHAAAIHPARLPRQPVGSPAAAGSMSHLTHLHRGPHRYRFLLDQFTFSRFLYSQIGANWVIYSPVGVKRQGGGGAGGGPRRGGGEILGGG